MIAQAPNRGCLPSDSAATAPLALDGSAHEATIRAHAQAAAQALQSVEGRPAAQADGEAARRGEGRVGRDGI